MRKNEPDPNQRVAGPIPFYNANGQLASGLTFAGAGETAIFNLTSLAFNDTTNNAIEADASGMYYVQLEQPETDFYSFLIVRLRKATYDDQFFIVPIDNNPDVHVASMAAAVIAAIQAGLATSANVTAAETSINANVDAAEAAILAAIPAATTIRDAVLNALLSNHATVGSVADGIAIAAGLLQGNFMMDNVDNTSPNGQTAARMRVWRTAAAMSGATSGGSGLQGAFASFAVTTTYEGPNKITMHKVERTA